MSTNIQPGMRVKRVEANNGHSERIGAVGTVNRPSRVNVGFWFVDWDDHPEWDIESNPQYLEVINDVPVGALVRYSGTLMPSLEGAVGRVVGKTNSDWKVRWFPSTIHRASASTWRSLERLDWRLGVSSDNVEILESPSTTDATSQTTAPTPFGDRVFVKTTTERVITDTQTETREPITIGQVWQFEYANSSSENKTRVVKIEAAEFNGPRPFVAGTDLARGEWRKFLVTHVTDATLLTDALVDAQ